VSLLGTSRATIVEHLRDVDDASVAELADLLGISEVATRRHLGVLEDEGLVDAHTVNQGRGRPAARYQLTGDARRLFPSAHDQLAAEALDFLGQTPGADGLQAFLRWRLERQVADLSEAVTATRLEDRLSQLADALSAAGFSASVADEGRGFTLTQDHCAIEPRPSRPSSATMSASGDVSPSPAAPTPASAASLRSTRRRPMTRGWPTATAPPPPPCPTI
jgi:predicted ArsR family transcriptional regulator